VRRYPADAHVRVAYRDGRQCKVHIATSARLDRNLEIRDSGRSYSSRSHNSMTVGKYLLPIIFGRNIGKSVAVGLSFISFGLAFLYAGALLRAFKKSPIS